MRFSTDFRPALIAAVLPVAFSPWTTDAADQWTPMAGGPARFDASAVWTGTEMIVWGNVEAGSRYNPSANSFTPLITGNQPPVRNRASALWTGAEMLVWGGYVQTGQTYTYPAQGGRFNPAANTWRPMSTTGFDAGRLTHSAVWTGSELIIWGGNSGGPVLNSGARYNPVTNAWTALTVTDGPGPRERHTAVWTGTEMIIWGGNTERGRYDTGVRFSPGSGTWAPISNAGAPDPRNDHTAIWTGTEMIVWGGRGIGNSLLKTGGRYNPATNTWTDVTATGAPAARWQHTGHWSGGEMIIWGGSITPAPVNTATVTGARYNPATNVWTAMTTTGAPNARMEPQAVWAGTEMIVWGGNVGSAVNNGGRYSFTPDPGTGPGAAAFAAWQTAIFGSPTAPGAGASDDPDKDGVRNLLEFAFNMDPLAAGIASVAPGAGVSGLPLIQEEKAGDLRFLTAEFIRRKNAGEWTVQASETLGGWTAANVTVITVTDVSPTYERVKVRINPVLQPGAKRFVRMAVNLQ